jgi:hypothetical protein
MVPLLLGADARTYVMVPLLLGADARTDVTGTSRFPLLLEQICVS